MSNYWQLLNLKEIILWINNILELHLCRRQDFWNNVMLQCTMVLLICVCEGCGEAKCFSTILMYLGYWCE